MKTYRGIAKVVKPLRYIRNKCARTTYTEKGASTVYVEPYPEAEYYASKGDGAAVQRIAMSLVRG